MSESEWEEASPPEEQELVESTPDEVEDEPVTVGEQIEDLRNKAEQAQRLGSIGSQAAGGLFNPATAIVAVVLVLVLIAALFVLAFSQTVGRNPNACQVGANCSVAQILPSTQCATTTVALTGADDIEKAYNYIVSKGYSPIEAAGIVGNFKAESGAVPWVAEYGFPPSANSPFVTGDYPGRPYPAVGGWGIGQWSFGRHVALKTYVISKLGPGYYVSQYTNGNPPMDSGQEDTLLATELDFLLTGEPAEKANLDAVAAATSPETAARIFHDQWERSAGWNPIRATYARQIYDKFNGSNPGASTDAGSSCTDGGLTTSGGTLTGVLAARWAIMKAKSAPCAVPWAGSGAPCGSWLNQCPKVVDLLYGGLGAGRGYGDGKDVAAGIISHGFAQSSGTSLSNVPAGAVISFDTGSTSGHVAVYAGNGIIWTNDFGGSGTLQEFKISDSSELTTAGIQWALPKPSWDLGGGP